MLFGEAFNLTEEGWRKLSVRWIAVLPGAGRSQRGRLAQLLRRPPGSNFKVFGILPLTLVFAMAQIGLIKRHEAEDRG